MKSVVFILILLTLALGSYLSKENKEAGVMIEDYVGSSMAAPKSVE